MKGGGEFYKGRHRARPTHAQKRLMKMHPSTFQNWCLAQSRDPDDERTQWDFEIAQTQRR